MAYFFISMGVMVLPTSVHGCMDPLTTDGTVCAP